MLLHELLRHLDAQLPLTSIPNVEVTGVKEDSRQVSAGNLFIARCGEKTNGIEYINDAKIRGAICVVSEKRIQRSKLPQVIVDDPARAASILSQAFFGSPSLNMRVFGVTGTNGKTTTTYLLRHLLAKRNQRCGMIGTVEIDDGRSRREASMTTPAACEIAELLGVMRDKGCRSVAMEISSHALEQQRVAGVNFAGAAFTNLTGDHLDYHGTMENYASAKAKLFASLDAEAVAVVNADSKHADRMIQDCCSRIIRFGFGKRADYRAKDIDITPQGSRFTLITPDGRADVCMQLIGKHNIENALAAAALAGEVCGLSVTQIAASLKEAAGAPGRLQAIRAGQPFAVLVDYAHTDDALENVLSALRPLTKGKLRVVFGCGGDRDRTKRPRMAKIAEKFADAVYVTSDNPRNEEPRAIINDILKGFSRGTRTVTVEPDRRAAIAQIIAEAESGDIVLIAGKGHENYQIVGDDRHHFDDVEEATRVLQGKAAAA